MTLRMAAAGALIVVGAVLANPVAAVLGIFALAIELVHALWSRRGLEAVLYARRLGARRVAWGGEIPMTIEVWNRQGLPLAWLDAREAIGPGVVLQGASATIIDPAPAIRNTWTLAPYERVVRHLRLSAAERGVFEIGPVVLSAGDVFARRATSEERPIVDRFLVHPRTVPTHWTGAARQMGDVERVRAGLFSDPSRFAGVRPYVPGDPMRHIHAKSSARLGQPVTKRFEPSQQRAVLLALDVQTATGPSWRISFDPEAVEALFVVAASVVRSLAARRAVFGVAAAGYSRATTRLAHLPASADAGQADRALDLMARLSSHPSAPFDHLLRKIRRAEPPGTTVVVVTARDPSPYAGQLRALQRAGYGVEVIACGPDADAIATTSRALALAARTARLDGPWRTAGSLVVAR